jgi:hypothetical protein
MRHEHKEAMKKSAAAMTGYFKNAHALYTRHDWPLRHTYDTIDAHIQECKDVIAKVRGEHVGPGKHKTQVEAVHAALINAVDFEFKTIHDKLATQSEKAGIKNHLVLDRPYHAHADFILYVNVVIAWLFAAKRQLMAVVEELAKQNMHAQGWEEAATFVQMSEHGRTARQAFEMHKHALHHEPREGKYDLQDVSDLKKQHDILYPRA